MVGALIRQLRLERDYSQEGLARGICAASYLSKIEQGQVEAGAEILDCLFQALGVTYCRDSQLLQEAEERLEAYYEAREREESVGPAGSWLADREEQLRYSDLCLSMSIWRIYRLLDRREWDAAMALHRQLKLQRQQMTPEQQYRWLVADLNVSSDDQEMLACLEEAVRIKPCAISWLRLGYLLYYLGRDSRCMEATEQAYRMAAEEGDLYVLIWASFHLGSCYCGHHLEFAEKYYRRAIRLGSRMEPKLESWAAYNLGASYLECGDTEKALYWLGRSEPTQDDHRHNLLLFQKKALLFYRLDRRQEAAEYLEQAEGCLEGTLAGLSRKEQELYTDMLRFARIHLEGVRDDSYERLLRRIYDRAGAELGFSFRRFYGQYLITLYRGQRRYKDALAVMEGIQRQLS